MKQYKHPKLWRTSKILDPTIWYQIYDDKGKKFESMSHPYSPRELVHLWFEEVVEEKKQDWKLDLYESLEWLFGKWLDELEEFLAFRKKLETHIPKQKKFTGNDVHEHSMKTYGSDSGFYVNFTLNFLRDHDLLEE